MNPYCRIVSSRRYFQHLALCIEDCKLVRRLHLSFVVTPQIIGMKEEPVDRYLSPVWDQFAVRAYIQLALCFPFDSKITSLAAAEEPIRASLQRLGQQRPELAAKLTGGLQGRAWLLRRAGDTIPFSVLLTDVSRLGGSYPTYEQLKEAGFPQKPFVHPDFASAGELGPGRPLPVSRVDVSFVEGGLILWVNMHHTLVDGDGARVFLDCFSGQTRGEEVAHAQNIAPAPIGVPIEMDKTSDTKTFQGLLQACRELTILPKKKKKKKKSGPMVSLTLPHAALPDQINKAVTLVFSHHALDRIKQVIERIFVPDASSSRRRLSSHVALGDTHADFGLL